MDAVDLLESENKIRKPAAGPWMNCRCELKTVGKLATVG